MQGIEEGIIFTMGFIIRASRDSSVSFHGLYFFHWVAIVIGLALGFLDCICLGSCGGDDYGFPMICQQMQHTVFAVLYVHIP